MSKMYHFKICVGNLSTDTFLNSNLSLFKRGRAPTHTSLKNSKKFLMSQKSRIESHNNSD